MRECSPAACHAALEYACPASLTFHPSSISPAAPSPPLTCSDQRLACRTEALHATHGSTDEDAGPSRIKVLCRKGERSSHLYTLICWIDLLVLVESVEFLRDSRSASQTGLPSPLSPPLTRPPHTLTWWQAHLRGSAFLPSPLPPLPHSPSPPPSP